MKPAHLWILVMLVFAAVGGGVLVHWVDRQILHQSACLDFVVLGGVR